MSLEVGEQDVGQTPCPACGERALVIEHRLEARKLGTYSLAGQQMKISATSWPWLRCTNCGVEARAKAEGDD